MKGVSMPELPEVEVTRLGISPHLIGEKIVRVAVHQSSLRWAVPDSVYLTENQVISNVTRRAKYLFIHTRAGDLVMHLGMSGKMRVVDKHLPKQKHDHIEIFLSNHTKLVFNDARRFGSCLFQSKDDEAPLKILSNLGPEPLTEHFDGLRLYSLSRNKTSPVKSFIMDNSVVVGVGNIYANESLFISGIDPRRQAARVSKKRYLILGENIKLVLKKAIEQGGTTLRDFTQADGKPGYFTQHLNVYGRAGEQCDSCGSIIKSKVIAQRNTFFCPNCQK